MPNPTPAFIAKCDSCEEEKDIQFSTLRGLASTLIVACGAYGKQHGGWRWHCSMICVAAELVRWNEQSAS